MNNKGRIMGVDFGEARCGTAISDAMGFLASGYKTIKVTGLNNLADEIVQIAKENEVKLIVMGKPINMNGTCGEKCEKVEAFAERLKERTELPVTLFDERCTTMAAQRYLNETNTRGKKRKAVIDTLSAQIILQNYLDSHK